MHLFSNLVLVMVCMKMLCVNELGSSVFIIDSCNSLDKACL